MQDSREKKQCLIFVRNNENDTADRIEAYAKKSGMKIVETIFNTDKKAVERLRYYIERDAIICIENCLNNFHAGLFCICLDTVSCIICIIPYKYQTLLFFSGILHIASYLPVQESDIRGLVLDTVSKFYHNIRDGR